ncbi:50S ribosomal protein L10 [Candidatus Micrarchaeota archaeon]|nr:50S ribosomal protein L10 [Candidatus Micrarchaeota archaeon]
MEYKIDVNRSAVKKKVEEVQSALKAVKKYKTVVLLDLRQLPDALFQKLRQKVRQEGGTVLVLRKPVAIRVLEGIPKMAKYTTECNKPMAFILTNKSPYDMNVFFKQNKKKRAAKIGEITDVELVVPAGDTDLPPGPALSELKAAGLNVQIKAGKIAVTKDSTLAKAGEKLTVQKIKALQSLNIQPFETMAKFIIGFDGEYTYSRELLDGADTAATDLGSCIGQGLNVSLNLQYPTGLNAEILLGNAIKQSMNVALNGNLYSTSFAEQLLVSAMRQGSALNSLEKK